MEKEWVGGQSEGYTVFYEKLNILHYITCNLADAFIQSDLQLIRLD